MLPLGLSHPIRIPHASMPIFPLLLADTHTCTSRTLDSGNDALAMSNHVILLMSSPFYEHDTLPTSLVRIPRRPFFGVPNGVLLELLDGFLFDSFVLPYLSPFLPSLPPTVKTSLRS